jgi:inorganic phosphate transporter, PiT family
MIGTLLAVGVAMSLLFAFTNGMKDGSNVFATAVASGSLSFRNARWLVVASELAGPFLLGIPVALTVVHGIVRVELFPHDAGALLLVVSGLTGAILWNLGCWVLRLPTSSSFALIGGLIGPTLFRFGLAGVPWLIFLIKVIGALVLSPVLGILIGGLAYRLLVRALRDAPLKTVRTLKRLQVASLIVLGMNHGTNDSQKTMGLIVLLLYLAGRGDASSVPPWVMAASVAALAAGITMGGTRIIRTVGYNIFRLRPEHSFSAQVSASLILLACNLCGAPVSSTQIISSSVIGVGSACRSNGVRWQVTRTIFIGWAVTIPATGILSILIHLGLRAQFLP